MEGTITTHIWFLPVDRNSRNKELWRDTKDNLDKITTIRKLSTSTVDPTDVSDSALCLMVDTTTLDMAMGLDMDLDTDLDTDPDMDLDMDPDTDLDTHPDTMDQEDL